MDDQEDDRLSMPFVDLSATPELRAGFFGLNTDRYLLIREEFSALLRDVQNARHNYRHFFLTGQPGVGKLVSPFVACWEKRNLSG